MKDGYICTPDKALPSDRNDESIKQNTLFHQSVSWLCIYISLILFDN